MSDETTPVTAEAPAAEPQAEATPAVEAPKADAPTEPDWRAAYVGLQRSQNRLNKRVEDVLGQNTALADTVKFLKEGQTAILKQTVGEDEVARMNAREREAQERSAALQAAQAASQFVQAQTGLFIEALQEAGVDPNTIDWQKDSSNVQEWTERMRPVIKTALRNANAERIRKTEEGFKAKSAKEVKEEAEALTQRQLKEAGVDRIDTARGGSPTTFAQRIAEIDPGSPEFAKMLMDAKAGRLKT